MEGRVLLLERQMARLRQALSALLLDAPPSSPPPPARAQKGFLSPYSSSGGGGGGRRAPPSSPVWAPGLPPRLPPILDEPLVPGLAFVEDPGVAGRQRLVFFDLETHGACRSTDETRIHEVAAVAWYGGGSEKATNTFRETVTPDGPRSWAAGGAFRFNAFVGPAGVLAGFNSKRFDARVLTFEHARVDEAGGGLALPPDVKFVDLMEVFRVLCPKVGVPRTLGAYHQALTGRAILSPHTALADAEALRACTEALIAARGEATVFEAIEGAWETAHAVQKRCGLC
jgi:hypothetical protein